MEILKIQLMMLLQSFMEVPSPYDEVSDWEMQRNAKD